MFDLTDLKKKHDLAYTANETTRIRAADDMVFYWITQWDSGFLDDVPLAYRGEFNILRKAGRQIISDLAKNPVEIDFVPKDETRNDAAELADGLYRNDDHQNRSAESYEQAKTETVVGGVGAWELRTEYMTTRMGDRRQVIRRYPVYEANNCVFWDPDAKALDKSDACYVSYLTGYSEDGYKKLVEELTGEELDKINANSFSEPEMSYAFPWVGSGMGEQKLIYVTSFYLREKVKDMILELESPWGDVTYMQDSLLKNVMDEMIDQGYQVTNERDIERWKVTKYIASGAEILNESVIAGEHIPLIPMYGERAIVEGVEHYEGVTRLAKDPQRLRNFQLSYLADIVSKSPRQKPIFTPEQLRGFEFMYQDAGPDNNYPYLIMNSKDEQGNLLPTQPVGVTPETPIPPALMASLDASRQAVEDVANPGLPQNIADPDLSGKAVLALQQRMDMQSTVYQNHFKHAKRRDAEIYISMAREVYDVPRPVSLRLADGVKKDSQVMKTVIDKETGDVVFLNDLRSAEFDVYSEIGPDYTSQKEQTIDSMVQMMSTMDPNDPMKKILTLKVLMLREGVNFDDIRDYARKQLILMGVQKPETPEEEQLLKQQMENQKPDPAMVLAQAEQMKGQADLLKEKRAGIEMQLDDANAKAKLKIEQFNAVTDRTLAQVKAKELGVNIDMDQMKKFSIMIDNMLKMKELNAPVEVSGGSK